MGSCKLSGQSAAGGRVRAEYYVGHQWVLFNKAGKELGRTFATGKIVVWEIYAEGIKAGPSKLPRNVAKNRAITERLDHSLWFGLLILPGTSAPAPSPMI